MIEDDITFKIRRIDELRVRCETLTRQNILLQKTCQEQGEDIRSLNAELQKYHTHNMNVIDNTLYNKIHDLQNQNSQFAGQLCIKSYTNPFKADKEIND